jgi:3-hydroxy acid dehydrogenase/malonic semialdehyde reductase
MEKRIVLITGATSGIGEAAALLLAENNFKLILCGRRKDRLDTLKARLSPATEIHTLEFDVRDKEAVKKGHQHLAGSMEED